MLLAAAGQAGAARGATSEHKPDGAAAAPSTGDAAGAILLHERRPVVPVAGVEAASLRATFNELRALRRHEALDIPAPHGTPVYAADDGIVAKLFHSVPGGLTVYQFDPSGRLAYYYAHLDRYADGLREGAVLKRCSVIGYVGSSGNASPAAPHLHFAVFRLGPEKRWWQGVAVDPLPLKCRAIACYPPTFDDTENRRGLLNYRARLVAC
jgi:murein DD-endopeptidase MepM/ murein hydrolase activator NlpD